MFRFTIRDMLSLTVVVAMIVGWWLNWAALTKDNNKLAAENTSLRLDLDKWVTGMRLQKTLSKQWENSATEQRLRADYLQDKLYGDNQPTTVCSKCGARVYFPKERGKPWFPPDGSHWPDAKPKKAY